MTRELRYEWRRITTVRSPWICLGLALLGGLAIAWLSTSSMTGPRLGRMDWVRTLVYPLVVANVLALVTSAQAIGQEYRFGMIRLTLTALPRRLPVLVAKAVVAAAWSVGIFVASVLGSWLVLVASGHAWPDGGLPGGTGGLTLRCLLVLLGWAAFGFGIATITRLTPLGITLPLVWGLVVESVVVAVLTLGTDQEWLGDVLPFQGASRATGGWLVMSGGTSPWTGLAVFWAWAAVLLVVGARLFDRRDA